jgi:hypothetical protein
VSERHHRASRELGCYLRLLASERKAAQHLDVRWMAPGGAMHRRFIAASRAGDAAHLIARIAPRADVYVGVALRDGCDHGGRGSIPGSYLLYVECDRVDPEKRLAHFPHPPTMVIASGTPGHLHLYWRLRERASRDEVESANRRLALALGGDPASVDIARILRPPGTLNHKHDPPGAVRLISLHADTRYALAELTSGLRAPQLARPITGGSPRTRREPARTRIERALLAIPATQYARVLAGLSPDRSGKVRCPFHEDSQPSLQLYPDGTFYCFGSGCARGGTIIDFAAAAWGLSPRGAGYLEIRSRLAKEFALADRAPG